MAARAQFAEQGPNASVRAIAKAAGVDPALPLHFYGSKDRLFQLATEWPFDFDAAVEQIVSGRRSQLGHRLVTFFLSIWDDEELRDPVVAVLRAAATSAEAAATLRETFGKRLLGAVGERLGSPDAPLRMSLCASQLVGLGVARYIIELEPLASMTPGEVASAVAPTLQRYMTGSL